MGEVARELGWGAMLYPATPRRPATRHVVRLVGELASGAYIAQPWFRGRRAVWRPDLGTAYSCKGKRLRCKLGQTINCWSPLDMMLMKDDHRVLDVMLPQPFYKRIVGAPNSFFFADVVDFYEVNKLFERWRQLPNFNGVVLKRTDVRYPWLPAGRQVVDGWWHLTKPL